MNPFINNQRFLFYMCAVVSIGGILYGYDVGVIAGALVFMQREISLTDTQLGLIVGAVLGGGLIGNLLAGHIADYFGRRLVLIIASIVFIVGISLVLIAQQFLLLFVARILLGKAMGLCLFFNSMTSTILAVYFIPLTTYLGMSNTYFLFSIFGLGYFLLVTQLLPETKALTLEKIHLGLTKTSIETN